MTKDEEYNLRELGDVIFIDGPHIKLNLKWEEITITLIDKNRISDVEEFFMLVYLLKKSFLGFYIFF